MFFQASKMECMTTLEYSWHFQPIFIYFIITDRAISVDRTMNNLPLDLKVKWSYLWILFRRPHLNVFFFEHALSQVGVLILVPHERDPPVVVLLEVLELHLQVGADVFETDTERDLGEDELLPDPDEPLEAVCLLLRAVLVEHFAGLLDDLLQTVEDQEPAFRPQLRGETLADAHRAVHETVELQEDRFGQTQQLAAFFERVVHQGLRQLPGVDLAWQQHHVCGHRLQELPVALEQDGLRSQQLVLLHEQQAFFHRVVVFLHEFVYILRVKFTQQFCLKDQELLM